MCLTANIWDKRCTQYTLINTKKQLFKKNQNLDFFGSWSFMIRLDDI